MFNPLISIYKDVQENILLYIFYLLGFFAFCAVFMFCYNNTLDLHSHFPYLATEEPRKMTYFESVLMVIFLYMLGVLLFKSFMLRK